MRLPGLIPPAVFAAVVWTQMAEAQTVRGDVVDRTAGRPAAGVVVQLMDAADRPVAHGLTDDRGQYRLSVPAPGTYRVRVLRIGFRPSISQSFSLAAGADVTLASLQAGAPVALDTIRVVGRNSCESMTDARATFVLWEQARTALTAARIGAGSRAMSARILTYARHVNPRSGRILRHETFARSGMTERPFVSIPPDSLRRAGYVVADEQNWVHYHAPDVEVLLSEEFLGDHCFRIAPESDRSRLGIAFSPTRERRSIPEISGTLWLDRSTSELRGLEFRYENVAPEVRDARAGGTVEFARLSNGSWVVTRWNIRMPVVERRYEAASGLRGSRARFARMNVTGIREEGGFLSLVVQRGDTLYAEAPLTIGGMVRDSLSRRGLPGARVALRGTGLRAETDTSGRFQLRDVLPGRYLIDVRTRELDAFGTIHTVAVMLADSAAGLDVRLPSTAQLAERACPASAAGILVGTVWRHRDSVAAPGASVVAEYLRTERQGQRLEEREAWLDATADIHGRFRICGVPLERQILLSAESDSGRVARTAVRLTRDNRVSSIDLVLDRPADSTATFSGLVLSDVNGTPIAEAQLLLPALPRVAFSDSQGAFRITGIPAGRHDVVVRHLGYRPLELQVELDPSQRVERRLLLSRVALLDTVAVVARPGIQDFEANRRIGLGSFWTRDMLEKHGSRPLGEVLGQTPKIRVVRGARSAAWIANQRGTRILDGTRTCFILQDATALDEQKTCGCYVQVWLDNMPLFRGGGGLEEVPNVNSIPVSMIEAIEFYSGPAETPLKYSTLNSHCGVLVIHTRRER